MLCRVRARPSGRKLSDIGINAALNQREHTAQRLAGVWEVVDDGEIIR